MRRVTTMTILIGLLATACAPRQQASVQLVGDSALTETPNVIFVTPTQAPTMIPTYEIITPSATPTLTPIPTSTPDQTQLQAQCDSDLTAVYTTASEMCLDKPDGYVCNGGAAPAVEPTGPIANALGNPGSTVEAALLDVVHTPALSRGGLAYVRLGEGIQISALLVGDVELRNTTPAGFPKWKNFTVRTTATTSNCGAAPTSAFVVQGEYGQRASVVINGVSVDLNGTVVIITEGDTTRFISLEGLLRLIVNGTAYSLYAGQEIDVLYPADNLNSPLQAQEASPLTWSLIEHLPVVLLDRPVLLPQPGYVETAGNVNMRAEPRENSQLIYQVPSGQVLDVLGQSSDLDWYHIRLGNGETGWMRADLLNGRLGTISLSYDVTPLPPQRFGALGSRAVISAAQGGNLRQGPDTYFNTITTLPTGTEIELIARSAYSPWVKVRGGGSEGWLALITLETQSVIAFLTVDYDAPLPPRPTSTPVFQFGGGHAYPNPNGGQ